MSQVMVVKHNGDKEAYDEAKIRSSATRVGVPQNLQNQMIQAIRSRLYDGIPTSDIFTIIKSFLTTTSSPYLASKYNLKSALSELGPSGYPFEQFVSRLLESQGFTTKTNETWKGACVTHEIDVVAKKEGVTYPIEAKFHSSTNQRTDIRVALYIWARYDDLRSAWVGQGELLPWIITNTRFSTDALKYAKCKAIKVTSWGFPEGQGIMDLIEQTKLHPITILETLSDSEKRYLISSGVLTCHDLLLSSNGKYIPSSKISHVLQEAQAILGGE